jgi:UDP:flavonoid glycosyltransferase YjiC (YdhE family)
MVLAQARCKNNMSGFVLNFVDWGYKVDVVGFCFLDLASNYAPPEPLMKWLEAGEKPIYIGFGSLVSSESIFSNELAICTI